MELPFGERQRGRKIEPCNKEGTGGTIRALQTKCELGLAEAVRGRGGGKDGLSASKRKRAQTHLGAGGAILARRRGALNTQGAVVMKGGVSSPNGGGGIEREVETRPRRGHVFRKLVKIALGKKSFRKERKEKNEEEERTGLQRFKGKSSSIRLGEQCHTTDEGGEFTQWKKKKLLSVVEKVSCMGRENFQAPRETFKT